MVDRMAQYLVWSSPKWRPAAILKKLQMAVSEQRVYTETIIQMTTTLPPSWIWSNRKWRVQSAIPQNPIPEPNTKQIGWLVVDVWPLEVFFKMAAGRHFGFPARNGENWITRCRFMVIWKFPKCANVPRGQWSIVGRSWIFILCTLMVMMHHFVDCCS